MMMVKAGCFLLGTGLCSGALFRFKLRGDALGTTVSVCTFGLGLIVFSATPSPIDWLVAGVSLCLSTLILVWGICNRLTGWFKHCLRGIGIATFAAPLFVLPFFQIRAMFECHRTAARYGSLMTTRGDVWVGLLLAAAVPFLALMITSILLSGLGDHPIRLFKVRVIAVVVTTAFLVNWHVAGLRNPITEKSGSTFASCELDVFWARYFLFSRPLGARVWVRSSVSKGLTLPLFHYVVAGGDLDLVNDYVEIGLVNPNEGYTLLSPLIIACSENKTEVVSLLLSKDAHTNVVDWMGGSPLCLAVENENFEMTKLLVEHGARERSPSDVDEMDDGRTALHVAAWYGNYEITDYLLTREFTVNVKDNENDTPLSSACEMENYELIMLLLKHGADPTLGNSPLLSLPWEFDVSSETPEMRAIKALLQKGADVNAADDQGRTVLWWLLIWDSNRPSSVRFLIEHGADPNLKTKHGFTPLFEFGILACPKAVDFYSTRNRRMAALINERVAIDPNVDWELMTFMVTKGGDVNVRDPYGRTLLHYAAMEESDYAQEVIKKLLALGATTDVKDDCGKTPLDLATDVTKPSLLMNCP